MKWLRLKTHEKGIYKGKEFYINPEHIAYIYEHQEACENNYVEKGMFFVRFNSGTGVVGHLNGFIIIENLLLARGWE